MTEGIVRIYMSVVEPEDKGLLWLRPYLDKEGYELLYYGSKGWVPLIYCNHSTDHNTPEDNTEEEEDKCPCDYL